MCVRVFCFWSVSVCYFVLFFSFGIRDRSLAWPSLPNSIRMCSLCLWPLLVKQQCQCGMFSELGGGIVGVGRAVQRQWGLPLNNHCSFSICTKKKRHFKLKFLHLPAMLFATNSDATNDKACWEVLLLIICLLKQREDLLKSPSYKCSLVCFASLAYFSCICTFLFAMDQCRCNHSWSRLWLIFIGNGYMRRLMSC